MTEHLTAAYGAVEQRCGPHAGGQPGERAGALRQGQLEDERAGEVRDRGYHHPGEEDEDEGELSDRGLQRIYTKF